MLECPQDSKQARRDYFQVKLERKLHNTKKKMTRFGIAIYISLIRCEQNRRDFIISPLAAGFAPQELEHPSIVG